MKKDSGRKSAETNANVPPDARQKILARLNRPPRPPNWAEWSNVKTASLWEVVAVSCNADPSDIRGWQTRDNQRPLPRDFENRLRIAKDLLDVNGGGLRSQREDGTSEMARINIGDFREWIMRAGVSLPPEFPHHEALKPPPETKDARCLRLRKLAAKYKSEGRRDFIAIVAKEEGCNPSLIHRLIGKKNERNS